ncbi:MAG TPA: serine/threonine-protein kinase [Acidimicrobiales bacterium]|nr:serine/threonine-protein kinase [Acidimicrobiales bacterium]
MALKVLAGRYELMNQLGAGAMAAVWRARDKRLDREVAIKMLSQQLASDPTFRERFEREAIHVASLKHPNIVTVHDSGAEDGEYYIVMELVEGQSLQSRLAAAGPRLTVAETERLADELLAGLAHAHRKGIIHRDIKPGNVLITDENTAKLADFGIARATGDIGSLTATGAFLGTPLYASPEQLNGQHVGVATDVYSLGCVLYQCLAGRPPFEADMPAGVVAQHLSRSPRPLRPDRPDIPPQLEAAVLTAMEKDPERRFGSAEDMRRGLQAAKVPGWANGDVAATAEGEEATPRHPSDGRSTVAGERLRTDPLDPAWLRPEPPSSKPHGGKPRPWMVPVIAGVIAVILLGGAGAGGYALVSSSSGKSSTSTTTPSTVTSTSSGGTPSTVAPTTTSTVATASVQRAQAGQISNLLAQNAGARNIVVNATQGVQNCTQSPASGANQLQSAISTRNSILNQLGSVPVDSLPSGSQMVSALGAAMRSSVTSDQDYIAWMGDVAAQGCPLSTATDASFQAATAASSQATSAKQSFVSLWNPIAAQFGLQQYNDTDL